MKAAQANLSQQDQLLVQSLCTMYRCLSMALGYHHQLSCLADGSG
uniref:Uncharacterized protein n=1 Tax=Anopheles gambiae TaxID=7165 RepID=A0ABK8G7S2_ANOGA